MTIGARGGLTHFFMQFPDRKIIIALLLGVLLALPSFVFAQSDTITLQIPVSGDPASSTIKLCDRNSAGGFDCSGIIQYVQMIYVWLLGAVGIVAVASGIFAGTQWMLSRGDSGAISKAKELLQNSLAGLGLTLGAYLLLWAINPDFVQLRPIALGEQKEIDLTIDIYSKALEKKSEGVGGDTNNNIALLKTTLQKAADLCKGKFTIRPDLAEIRTWSEQKILYDKYLAGRGNLACNPGPREAPNRCPHMSGNAVDLSSACSGSVPNPVVAKCMKEAGFDCVLMGAAAQAECWHYEVGQGISGGCVDPAKYY